MQFFTGLTGASKPDAAESSVLAQWKSYEGGGGGSAADVEAGKGDDLFGGLGALGTSVSKGISTITGAAADAADAAAGPAGAAAASGGGGFFGGLAALPSIPTGQQLVYFTALMAAGSALLMLSFFVFLPLVILAPAKFALSFTLGCACVLSGFAVLQGWQAQLAHLLSPERRPFTAGYLASMVGTLYAALVMNSYLLSLVFSAVQVLALLYYVASYFPGGAAGVRFVGGMAAQGCWTCATSMLGRR